MEIRDEVLDAQERIGYRLRTLYHEHGYRRYRMSKFEEYDLYSRNKDFLFSDSVITFTDTTGRLMALKPDVTLSIVKNTKDLPGSNQKLYYHENVYRVSSEAGGFREQTQVGLECMGDVEAGQVGEVLKLAEESLALLSGRHILEISHLDILNAFVEAIATDDEMKENILKCAGEKNLHPDLPGGGDCRRSGNAAADAAEPLRGDEAGHAGHPGPGGGKRMRGICPPAGPGGGRLRRHSGGRKGMDRFFSHGRSEVLQWHRL